MLELVFGSHSLKGFAVFRSYFEGVFFSPLSLLGLIFRRCADGNLALLFSLSDNVSCKNPAKSAKTSEKKLELMSLVLIMGRKHCFNDAK